MPANLPLISTEPTGGSPLDESKVNAVTPTNSQTKQQARPSGRAPLQDSPSIIDLLGSVDAHLTRARFWYDNAMLLSHTIRREAIRAQIGCIRTAAESRHAEKIIGPAALVGHSSAFADANKSFLPSLGQERYDHLDTTPCGALILVARMYSPSAATYSPPVFAIIGSPTSMVSGDSLDVGDAFEKCPFDFGPHPTCRPILGTLNARLRGQSLATQAEYLDHCLSLIHI